jgi:tRNA pseudouridine synthase 10
MDVLAVARSAVATGPVCDACLGRLVAGRSHGLENAERGKALCVTLALTDDEPHEPPAECWVCEGESERYDEFAARAVRRLEGCDFATYQVGTRVPPLLEENDALLREEAGLDADAGEGLDREFNREVGRRIGIETGAEVDLERPDVLVVLDLATDEVEIQVNSAFVYGRYRKLERGIPQTKWPCSDCDGRGTRKGTTCETCDGSGFRYETSVEQEAAPVVRERMNGREAVFHGAGREDVDARMLEGGRPFVVEVKEPRRRDVDIATLAAEINRRAGGRIEVEGLRPATHDMVERVKRLDASKTYRAEVRFGDPVDADALADALEELRGTTVEQHTPDRVAHRRAEKVRRRTVYDATGDLDGEAEPSRAATVEIHGEGGLYVKELVSGDGGRTEPSLAGLLGVDAEVTALDVLGVEGEEEAFERPEFFRDAGEDTETDAGTV